MVPGDSSRPRPRRADPRRSIPKSFTTPPLPPGRSKAADHPEIPRWITTSSRQHHPYILKLVSFINILIVLQEGRTACAMFTNAHHVRSISRENLVGGKQIESSRIKKSACVNENESPDEGQGRQENKRKRKRHSWGLHRQCLQAMMPNHSVETVEPSLVGAAKGALPRAGSVVCDRPEHEGLSAWTVYTSARAQEP